MNMTKRLDALEAELDRQDGKHDMQIVVLKEGETEAEARRRSALGDHVGQVIFISFEDAGVL